MITPFGMRDFVLIDINICITSGTGRLSSSQIKCVYSIFRNSEVGSIKMATIIVFSCLPLNLNKCITFGTHENNHTWIKTGTLIIIISTMAILKTGRSECNQKFQIHFFLQRCYEDYLAIVTYVWYFFFAMNDRLFLDLIAYDNFYS